jgi:hypothetical protein
MILKQDKVCQLHLNCFAPVISPIFNLNGENQTGTERYMNGTEKINSKNLRYEPNGKGQILNLAHA